MSTIDSVTTTAQPQTVKPMPEVISIDFELADAIRQHGELTATYLDAREAHVQARQHMEEAGDRVRQLLDARAKARESEGV